MAKDLSVFQCVEVQPAEELNVHRQSGVGDRFGLGDSLIDLLGIHAIVPGQSDSRRNPPLPKLRQLALPLRQAEVNVFAVNVGELGQSERQVSGDSDGKAGIAGQGRRGRIAGRR